MFVFNIQSTRQEGHEKLFLSEKQPPCERCSWMVEISKSMPCPVVRSGGLISDYIPPTPNSAVLRVNGRVLVTRQFVGVVSMGSMATSNRHS